jgi:hypothetical protein
MMRKAKWLGMMSVATALVSVAIAQTPVQKLEQSGKLSFRLNDSPYYIRVGVGCNLPAFSGGIGDQDPICKTLSDLNGDGIALDFQATIQEIVNDIQSNELVTFIGTPVAANRVRWTGEREFDPPHCAFITGSVQSWFKITRVYADFTMEISEGSCQLDPYNCLCGDLTLAPFGNTDPPNENVNYMGFDGLLVLADTCDSTSVLPTCARTYNINAVAYGGGLFGQGDVNNDCTIDDADLLIVLFNFGGTGAGDINRDGVVDDADLLIVLFNFGNSC